MAGSIIRDLATGRIRGFLQETGALDRLAGVALPGGSTAVDMAGGIGRAAARASPVHAAIDVAGFAMTGMQNEQIKSAIAAVRSMQAAGLALGVAGIGVSLASAAVLYRKIGRVEAKVDALADRLDAIGKGVEALRLEPVRQDFTRLRTVAAQVDEGWNLADPAPEWRAAARDAHMLADSLARRAGEAIDADAADVAVAEPMLDALALAAATRVTARLAAGDDIVARQAAGEGAEALAALGGRIRIGEAALARVATDGILPGTPDWRLAVDKTADELRTTVATIRARELAAASTEATLVVLEQRGIGGRAWLEAAREEQERALLYLPAEGPDG